MIGKTVSHYQVIEKLGAGGMGEVYRAHDTTLDRQVAIKILPDIFSGDPERLARFEREAKVLASLNHPNIAAIYGLEQADGKRFLVMELVEGETLAQRISKGALPIAEALPIAQQIAEALEAAHEQGIIHRDLKPANIKVRDDGTVKVLDFGLAKALEPTAASSAEMSNSPTLSVAATGAGMILGTAAYMSPEQAVGKAADKRSDLWAFGVVLFEMLTGRQLFTGETVSHILAEVLKTEPDWTALPSETPMAIQRLLRRCLEKDRKQRLDSAAAARIEIKECIAQPAEVITSPRRFPFIWTAAAAVALLAGFIADRMLTEHSQPPPPAPVVISTIDLEPGHWLAGMQRALEMQHPSRTAMAISSDGSFVVYSAIAENPGPQAKSQLYLRRMDQSTAKPISGTEGGINPFLSPDNRWVGFWADGKLKKIPIEGGILTTLCDTSPYLYGASWGPSNSILFADGQAAGLSMVSAEGGKPEILTKPDPKQEESSHRLPFWLPNGKAVLFTVMRHGHDPKPWIALLRLDSHEWHALLQDAADARYVPTGHILFLRQGMLMAVRFDLATLEVIGKPVGVMENVIQGFSIGAWYHTGAGQFSISDTGTLIYAPGGIVPDAKNSLVWVDQKGIEQAVADLEFPFDNPRLSPDGQRIAHNAAGKETQIWVYDIARGTNSQLTREGYANCPIWALDGKRLLFSWVKSVASNIFWQPYDGSLPIERLTTSEYAQSSGSLSPDGKTVAIVEYRPGTTESDIAMLDLGTRHVATFLNSQFNEQYPEFSPDGRWIAYASDESMRIEVYVQDFPGRNRKIQVSSEGGNSPLWARNGKQLFYRWQDQFWVVDVQTGLSFSASKPRLLFEKSGYRATSPIRSYDLSLDSQRFLMVKLEERKPTPVTKITLVQNWFEELKRLVSTGK